MKTTLGLFIIIFFISCHQSNVSTNRLFLGDFLSEDYKFKLGQFSTCEMVAVASFPANDFFPGEGNTLVLFERTNNEFVPILGPYPLKVAGQSYRGYHTGYKRRFLKSPVGVFGVHKGSKNESRFMSWMPEIQSVMAEQENVPAFGVKVNDEDKPQKHFHYSIHCLPPHYNATQVKKKAFSSLGCWSLLTKDMRELYSQFSTVPSANRVLISMYDTMSIDIKKGLFYIYKDIYNENFNSLAQVKKELKNVGLNPKKFNEKKMLAILDSAKINDRQVYSLSDLR